jgi:hypothetical protein
MKIFDLLCEAGHRFEGWFGSAEDFASQRQGGQLECPACGSAEVQRVPSTPRVNFGATAPQPPAKTPDTGGRDPFAIAQMLYSRMLDELLARTEDVGKSFPAEARRIFREEVPARPIRGLATPEEHDELLDEGIPVARLPVPPSSQLN